MSAIAKSLSRPRSTILREIKRNSVFKEVKQYYQPIKKKRKPKIIEEYNAKQANEFAQENKRFKRKTKLTHSLVEYIDNRILKDKYPPDVIAHEIGISTKTIYNWIDKGLVKTKNIDLWQKVGRKPRKKPHKQPKRQLGTSIEFRPQAANDRSEFGHWEGDTIVGKNGRSAFLTLTERQTGHGLAIQIGNKKSKNALRGFNKLDRTMFKSLTLDNGTEFSQFNRLKKKGIQVYFAHPYSSFERGTNEHFNGMLRRFFPKGKDLNKYSQTEIDNAVNWINNLPRKAKNYQTPATLFQVRGMPLTA